MKNLIKLIGKLFLLAVILQYALPSYAIMAKPGLIVAQQPDGSSINIRLVGSERNHKAYSEDGFLLTSDGEGYYVFADVNIDGQIIPSAIREINVDSRSKKSEMLIRQFSEKIQKIAPNSRQEDGDVIRKGPGLIPNTFPSMGVQKSIVVLVEFTDKTFTIPSPNDYFNRMLNQQNFSDDRATGSARDYFYENSSGLFEPQFDVYGPVLLPNPYAYYGQNDRYDNDMHPEEMAIHACEILDPIVDFSQYDRNNDGKIDNVYVFYAGYGEADGGSADTVWPHSWDISAAKKEKYIYDGVQLDHYACSNELQSYPRNNPDGIGSFCHEFSHVLGLPDLYATSYTTAYTPGDWSILDSGSYNNNSRTPPNYSAFERYALDWMTPSTLKDGETSLAPIGTFNEAFIINTDKENEFFLLENRQKEGFDQYIPGHGMLVWHIDYNARVWQNNTVNNSASHQYVDLLEADNKQTPGTAAGDAFPGTSNVTEISGSTTPGLVYWSKKKSSIRIYDIKEYGGLISFKVEGASEDSNESGLDNISVSDGFIEIKGNTVIFDSASPVNVYDIKGVLICSQAKGSAEFAPGFYIASDGNKYFKFRIL